MPRPFFCALEAVGLEIGGGKLPNGEGSVIDG